MIIIDKELLPNNWKVQPIADFLIEYRGGAPLNPKDFSNEGFPVLPKKAIGPGGKLFIPDESQTYCTIEFSKKYPKSIINDRYLITTLRDLVPSGPSIGHIVKFSGKKSFLLAQGVYGFLLSNKLDENYLIQISNTEMFRRIMKKIMVGSTQVHIRTGEYFDTRIPIPPLPEQRKIAEILSTWDEVITKTEQLIEALRQRKKGLMQRLLTGQVRFPGFDGEWENKHMHELFSHITRKVGNSKINNFLSITATVGFVDQREKFGKVIAGENLKNYIHLKKGEFSYNRGNSKPYPQGCIYLLREFEEGAAPSVYYSFTVKNSEFINKNFYRHYFESGSLNPQLRKYISSSVRNDGLFNISFTDFFNIVIPYPSIEEQRKIADVLETCDKEIKRESKKLELLKLQKKGLMQRLLTGQISVKV